MKFQDVATAVDEQKKLFMVRQNNETISKYIYMHLPKNI